MSVKSFSGARISDMDDYLKPLLRKEPDEVILHVGTNNIRDESSRSVAEGIINMASQVQQDFPSTRLTISPLLPRSDNLELNDKIKEANKILNSFCSSRGLTLLHITNIDLTCLNRRGVHLNRKGSALAIAMPIFLGLVEHLVVGLLSLPRPGQPIILTVTLATILHPSQT